jgi:hypothetical protein
MTQDEAVAFPLCSPVVLAGIFVGSNPGRHAPLLARSVGGPQPISMTGGRDALSAKSIAKLSAKLCATSWQAVERGYSRPPCWCWPPLNPGLSALQS